MISPFGTFELKTWLDSRLLGDSAHRVPMAWLETRDGASVLQAFELQTTSHALRHFCLGGA